MSKLDEHKELMDAIIIHYAGDFPALTKATIEEVNALEPDEPPIDDLKPGEIGEWMGFKWRKVK